MLGTTSRRSVALTGEVASSLSASARCCQALCCVVRGKSDVDCDGGLRRSAWRAPAWRSGMTRVLASTALKEQDAQDQRILEGFILREPAAAPTRTDAESAEGVVRFHLSGFEVLFCVSDDMKSLASKIPFSTNAAGLLWSASGRSVVWRERCWTKMVAVSGPLQFRSITIPLRYNSAPYGFDIILQLLFASVLDICPLD